MSSLRVRTKNKLLTAFGAAKPSTNVAYDLAYSDFESTLQRLATLDTALKAYAGSLKTFHGAASTVVGAIDGLSSGGTGTASFQQKPVGASEMQQFAGEARVACADVDTLVLQEAYGRLEQEVLLPVRGWLQHARSLQNEATAFLEQKALYDHYSRKVATLREAHEKRASSGRNEKSKDTERMFRNEQKLAATTQEYTRLSDTVIRDLRAFVMSRDAALAPLLRRVLRGRVIYADRMHEATGRIRALIEDGVEESEDGGVLGQFMTVAQGGGPVGSAAIMAAATNPHPAPCTVRKSSFEEFVGESAPNMSRKSVSMDDNWAAFASPPPPPPEHDVQMPSPTNGGYGYSEPHYTPPHAVPQFMTMNTPSNAAASRMWGDEFPAAVFSTTPANVSNAIGMSMVPSPPPSPTSVSSNPWDVFPSASAPTADAFQSGEWGAAVSSQAPWQQQQQQQVPVAEFRDMHMNALGGDVGSYR
ncbi:hypothetical protein PF005_g17312 [Phytophthora fragariae]|uniref:BAR domain-containing protein n=2 Tax=Phytophthora TaxID=4783 RepID=A0A6A3Y3J1_9STRA|nr:hypothetical protein PF003_g12051 [Phytophthora fragariae]KAE9012758.1 hypothetical protein PR002_g14717 [Phytophthora rubi]KAE8938074.1 hypothetical protein PF009_g12031 [Phytophthora fragariae]KAE9003825.1 hypothetical protein PF011_g12733 [Phytophthora fragariae]KAE9017922.1 hypothetical protein PR001_g14271 [Phytophthora rubi]